jgi:hypothetical protein
MQHTRACVLFCLVACLLLIQTSLGAIPNNTYVSDTANCLTARWSLVFGLMTSGIQLKFDPFVYSKKHSVLWNATLCTSDPYAVYMDDDICQCDAAKQFYINQHPTATMSTAFQMYLDEVARAVANNFDNATTWHCEACPGAVKAVVNTYSHLPASCTCIAAREAFLAQNSDIADSNYDPVAFYNLNGYTSRVWPDCSVCASNAVYIDNPNYRNCAAAHAAYVVEPLAWWAPYFNDTWLAYWNSFTYALRPMYHYEYCSPVSVVLPANNPYLVDSSNCIQARWDMVFQLTQSGYKITYDIYTWTHLFGFLPTASICTSDPDPVYLNDPRCQCNAAKYLYIQGDPEANLETAFQHYSDGVMSSIANGIQNTATWHCEACPNALKKRTPAYKYSIPNCTCIAAREQYYVNNPDVLGANFDAVGFYEKYPSVRPWVDCSLCNVNPIFIDNPGYATCATALSTFVADPLSWWAGTFYDPFLAYWNSFWIVGQPIFHYETCTPVNLSATATTTSTTTISTTSTGSPTGSTPTSSATTAGSSGTGFIDDPSNCLAARWDFVWGAQRSGYVIQTDPFVWTLQHLAYLNSTLCTSDPDPIYMDDERCQCDAAKQFYIQANPSATMDTAFQLYSNGVGTAVGAHSDSAINWHCEACPNTVTKRTPNYKYSTDSCTCTKARDTYLTINPDVKGANYDAVGFYERYGATGGRPWVDCSLCATNPIYIDNPGYVNCTAALTTYVADSIAWWAKYFYDPFLSVYNSFWLAGQPRFQYELCTAIQPTVGPTSGPVNTNNSIVTDPSNCLAARLNLVYALEEQQTELKTDPKIWALGHGGGGWQTSLCTSDPDAVYMWQDRCQCDLAKRFYMQDDPSATMETAYQLWATRVGAYDTTAPTWHCEACPGTVKQKAWTLLHVPYNCTCLAAREAYFVNNGDVKNANFDPVYFQEALGWSATPPRVWDCTPCATNPVYIDADISQNCSAAHTKYISEAWWAEFFHDPFLAYWTSVMLVGHPQYHYEYCTDPDTSPVLGIPKHLNYTCTCMAARLAYWADHLDVWEAGLDPVSHYDNYAWDAGVFWTWKCELCQTNPVYIDQSVAQCSDAVQTFSWQYQNYAFADPWTFYITNYLNTPSLIWHAELCPGVVHAMPDVDQVALPASCVCLAARLDYWNRYPASKLKDQDPVWYYTNVGKTLGWTWNCDLCSDTSGYELVFLDDPVCQTCESAKTKYLTGYNYLNNTIGADYYYDTWLHYWNNYMALGLSWHCEDCVNISTSFPTTSGASSTTGSGSNEPLPEECRCLQAQNQYLNDHMDVREANNDPIKFYLTYGYYVQGSNNWKCSLCDYNPIYMDQCNCTNAQLDFINRYQYTSLDPASAFEYYNTSDDLTITWDCTKCNISISPVKQEAQCITARTDYLARYPEVLKNSPYYMDAVYFQEYIGFAKGYTWNSTLCKASSVNYEDSVCNCKEAIAKYSLDYPSGVGYQDYVSNHYRYGMAWRCDLCANNQVDPSSSLACNCTAARQLYAASYNISQDPWVDYTSTGKDLGNVWDCAICNDTCHAAPVSTSAWAYTQQKFSTASNVVVPSGCYVPFAAQQLNVFSLTVSGSLRCVNVSSSNTIGVAGQKLVVNGVFQCGTATVPFGGHLSVALAGIQPTSVETTPGGTKGIIVSQGGTLLLHGIKQVSWTHLAQSAAISDTQIQVTDAVDWSVGDQIVITSTDIYGSAAFSANEAKTISGISGNVITLSTPLSYSHAAEDHDIEFSTQTSLLTLHKRAEVALLSRNIVITSDATTQLADLYGTHVTALSGSRVYVSGVQISLAGQENNGTVRYPFEWDTAGSVNGQYFKHSTITQSAYGCVGVRNTANATVSNIVCHDFKGHGFVIHNGTETNNVFDSNIGIALTTPSEFTLVDEPVLSNYGVFVIKNPNNVFKNNVAVASSGPGYWIQLTNSSHVASANAPWGTFVNNTAHAVYIGYSSCVDGLFATKNSWDINQLSVYGAAIGIYPCGTLQSFQDIIVAESQVGFQSDSVHHVTNAAFVTRFEDSRTLASSTASRLTASGWSMDHVAFINYDSDPEYAIFFTAGADFYNSATQTSNVDRQNSGVIFADPTNSTFFHGYYGQFSTNVFDSDGTLTNYPGYTLVTDHPMMFDDNCVKLPSSSFGYVCPYNYSEIRISFATLGLPIAAVGRYSYSNSKRMALRSELVDDSAVYFPPPDAPYYRWSSMVNSNYIYTYLMPLTKHAITNITMPNSHKGDTIALDITNVLLASGFSNALQVGSCDTVFSSQQTQQSYFYDGSAGRLCVRLFATTPIANANTALGYTSTIYLTATSDKSTVGQPAAPFTDGPSAVPQKCTCLAAMQDYWTRYPNIYAANIDPLYHYQEVIGPNNPAYTWNCPCDDEPHFVTEIFCNCTAARNNYTAAYPQIIGKYDPYEHYLLYELVLGYGYHCEELCTPPESTSQYTYKKINSVLSAVLGAIIGVAVLLNFFALVTLVMGYADYTSHGKFYSGVVIIGAFLAYISAFIVLPEPTDALCLAFPWFLGIGFTFVYGCLFIKTWTLYKVWRNAEQYKKSNLTPMYIMKGIGMYVFVEIIIMVIWSVIDPPKAQYKKMVDGDYDLGCHTKHNTFWIIFLATKGVWLLFGTTLTVLTRRIATEFNQSRSIGYAIYNIVVMLIIGVPLAIALENISGGVLIIEVAVIVVAFTFTNVSLFFDLWYTMVFPEKNVRITKMSSVRGNSSPTVTTRTTSSGGSKDSQKSQNSSA